MRARPGVLHAVVVFGMLAAAPACRRGGVAPGAVAADLTLTPAAPRVGEPTEAHVTVHTPQAAPITGATVQIEAQMQHPGMAPVVESAIEHGAGAYDGHLSFTMAGDWVVFMTLTTSDGQRVRKQIGQVSIRPAS
jgi:YtkA-like